MPFIALYEEEIIYPDEVTKPADISCPDCEREMHIRSKHRTENGVFKPKCFVHNSKSGGGCGESDEHKLMKYVASRNLADLFPHADIGNEVDIPGTGRRADVVAKFDEPLPKLGRGAIVEVQYKNDTKHIEEVTEEYLDAGFSVYWVWPHHFGEKFRSLTLPEAHTPWPDCVPATDSWSGLEGPVVEIREMDPATPTIPVAMPPEWLDRYRGDLRTYWELGAGEHDYDLTRKLSGKNAKRRCDTCGDPADLYLFSDGVISTFRCSSHAGSTVATDGGVDE